MSSTHARPAAGADLVSLLRTGWPWLVGAGAGWGAHHLAGGPAPDTRSAILVWVGGLALALAVGTALSVAAGRRTAVDRRSVTVLVGWGVANAVGWALAVEVGGLLTGLTLALVVRGAAGRIAPWRLDVVGGAGVAAVLAGRLAVAESLPPLLGMVVSIACCLLAVAVTRALVAPTLPLGPVAALVAIAGAAWVLAWMAAEAVLSARSASVSVAVEVLVATAVVAAASGWVSREPVGRTVVRWTGATVLGLAGASAVAVAATAAAGGTVIDHLDIGSALALPVAAWWAVRPTLRAVLSDSPDFSASTE